jgi:signal transduction histidine kinase
MLKADQFRRDFRYLILLTWLAPPIMGLGFILFIRVLTWRQMQDILLKPIVPLYSVGWLVIAILYFSHYVQPVYRWLSSPSPESAAPALHRMRYFPLYFWAIFLVYLTLAPASVIFSAEYYTDYVARPVDWFRIQLVALIISIIVGLPIFFLLLDLFGRALGDIRLARAHVTIKTKIFLVGALVPLLIDTMLVQYYWTRTGFFTFETFLVWLSLEVLAIAGSLIFVHSIAHSMAPLRKMIRGNAPADTLNPASLQAESTDELGVLACGYRELLEELAVRNEVLSLNNRILHTAEKVSGLPQLIDSIVSLGREAIGDDQAFLLLYDDSTEELVGVAQTGSSYDPGGYYRIAMQEPSLANWVLRNQGTVAVDDVETDPRVSRRMRERFRVKSALATPLRYENQPIGVLMTVKHRRDKGYTNRELLLIESLANEAAIAITTARLDAKRRTAEVALQQSRDELEIKVNERTADLEASNRELESFSYSVSHDLRAPLRAIDGYSEALLHEYPDSLDERGRNYLDRIRRNAQRMAELIDDLLNLSRIGRTDLRFDTVDLQEMSLEIIQGFRERQPERQVVFDVHIDGTVRGDRQLLRIALENLLANAWKYTRRCELARIRFASRVEDDAVVYSVSDNGAGFDMTYANKLFKPFDRLHRTEEFEGTGIGLAIVARIVQRHGGRIWAHAEVGHGATFYFTLPSN